MQIVCPDCGAAYEVPDGMLADTRPVRCARCGREWSPTLTKPEDAAGRVEPMAVVPRPPSIEPAPPHPLDPEVRQAAATPRPAAVPADWTVPRARAWRDPVLLARVGWAGSFLLLVVLAWAAYTWRGSIIHVWPPSERLYLALGMS